jgi:biotin transporter BioY
MQPPSGAANPLFVASWLFECTRAATICQMKQNAILVVTSLLSILLLTLHITDDIVRGISKAEPSNIALIVLAVFLYGTLVLAERRSGYVIMLFVGLFAAGMPVIHMRGAHYGEIAKSSGGFFFVWTLWALGALGGVTVILSARGLWSLRRGQPR